MGLRRTPAACCPAGGAQFPGFPVGVVCQVESDTRRVHNLTREPWVPEGGRGAGWVCSLKGGLGEIRLPGEASSGGSAGTL